jgi:prolyl oligopeptidase
MADARAVKLFGGTPGSSPASPGEGTETIHGVPITDPFRGLEDKASSDTVRWLDAQKRHTEAVLNSFPARAQYDALLRSAWTYQRRFPPILRGERRFFLQTDGTRSQPAWYAQDGDGAAVLDPTDWSSDGSVRVGAFELSPDGRYIAYCRHVVGSAKSSLYIRDTTTRCDLPEILGPCRMGFPAWRRDSCFFFYARLDDGQERIFLHEFGAPPSSDELIFEPGADAGAFTWSKRLAHGEIHALYVARGSDERHSVAVLRENSAQVQPISAGGIATTEILHVDGNDVYAITDLDAPRKRVVRTSLADVSSQSWQTIIPECYRRDKSA